MSNEAQSPIDYEEFRRTPEFQQLKRRFRRFVFPLTVAFMVWFLGYVVLAAFAPDIMAIPIPGVVNLGMLLGLLQFVSTFVITMSYVSFANKRLDPVTTALRAELEAREATAGTTGGER